ncbi:MAG TPA: DeoR/GlpR family DNA-binding transcription regulator [Thermoleophilaceae bacterium]|nr:DeoR/GlpR family DNA-binding transcription regulator [Thermoleophilaceae bacterium]
MTRSAHHAEERLSRIVDLLAQQELASTAELRELTGASEATARRDLDELERRGLLERTRGGARRIKRDTTLDEAFERRRRRNARTKAALAARAADLVPPGTAVFLNDGSTMFALAQELARRQFELAVATSALNIAELLARYPTIDVTVIGGSLRRTSFGTIGPLATDAICTLHADIAFLGCDGFDTRQGIHSNSLNDAAVARSFAEQADNTTVVADASKLGNRARAKILGWGNVDRLVTDTDDKPLRQSLARNGTNTVQVAPAS